MIYQIRLKDPKLQKQLESRGKYKLRVIDKAGSHKLFTILYTDGGSLISWRLTYFPNNCGIQIISGFGYYGNNDNCDFWHQVALMIARKHNVDNARLMYTTNHKQNFLNEFLPENGFKRVNRFKSPVSGNYINVWIGSGR